MSQNNKYFSLSDCAKVLLSGGYLYIGKQNSNPKKHPIAIYSDVDLMVPVEQPVQFLINFPREVFASTNFSIMARDKNHELVGTFHPSAMPDFPEEFMRGRRLVYALAFFENDNCFSPRPEQFFLEKTTYLLPEEPDGDDKPNEDDHEVLCIVATEKYCVLLEEASQEILR